MLFIGTRFPFLAKMVHPWQDFARPAQALPSLALKRVLIPDDQAI
jgi:hypothetical protein